VTKREPSPSEDFSDNWEPPDNPAIEPKRQFARSYPQRRPNRLKANRAVAKALRKGLIYRQPCEVCGTMKRLEAHHDSYEEADWLKVRWLCKKHHDLLSKRAQHG